MSNELGKKAIVSFALFSLVMMAFMGIGCSSGNSSSAQQQTPKQETVAGYSVSEYNSDVAMLEQLLSDTKGPYDAMNAMGDPNSFTSQEQVDEYNYYVDQYNMAADAYNSAADAFGKKYGMTIDGMGSRGVDPYSIDLPSRKS